MVKLIKNNIFSFAFTWTDIGSQSLWHAFAQQNIKKISLENSVHDKSLSHDIIKMTMDLKQKITVK